MLSQRLSIALDDGIVALPDAGIIAVFEPHPETDLSDLPKNRTAIITRHFPTYSRFQTNGYGVQTGSSGGYVLAIVCLPRAKDAARALVARALATTDGPVVVDGQKTDGIESMLKDLKKRGTVRDVVVKAHGKLCVVEAAACEDWTPVPTQITAGDQGFETAPGVFSADGVDPGSAALAAALPSDLKGRVADLGAGWGYLSHHILQSEKVKSLDLIEADFVALEAARRNVKDARATFHWADALTFTADPYDHVITNPPFHMGRTADPGLGQKFIQTAARLLKPRGQLWLVANRHLPYEKTLESAFREVRTLSETGGYKITHALAPRTSRKG